ncbi:MAG TPA: thymidylate kinase [Candidatus Enterenecus stercoripullorum]|nr:thymidylate kinase [Candidatus Enterenecus stercoripullorum]
MAGRLIVFEGTDGSGKSTQFALARQALEREGREFRTFTYPQYQEESSALVRMYLGGQFGTHPSDVNAYAASTFFAVDRYAGYKRFWGSYYEQGGLMMLDRYTTSNAVHQSSKLAPPEREAFFRWLADFEYGALGLPRPDLVLWLDMPTQLAVNNLRRRERVTHTIGDIHEVDAAYLSACRDAAAQAADFFGWRRVACTDGGGALRTQEDIHKEILSYI